MNKLLGVLTTIVVITVAIAIGFYVWFAEGMRRANSAKPIITNYSEEYKANFKKDYPYIQDIDIYYKQGRIYFDFIISPQVSLDECKQVIKKTKDILQDNNINESLLKGYRAQNSIQMRFHNMEYTYSFSCPYYIPTPDNTDNPNATITNNYKVWYMNVNNQPSIQIDF
jgi:hypothetical protein